VEHIVKETERMMRGMKHEEDWMFYHDALTLMTAKETIAWMKDKGHFERWILPANRLHTDDPSLKYYFCKPVGNSPEMMPWDTSLNQDVKCAVDRHVMSMADFEDDNPLKFSLSTPKRGARAFVRVLEGVPSSHRIIHDITKVIASMVLVQAKSGVLVQGVGNRNNGTRQPKTLPARGRAARPITGESGPTLMRRKCWRGSWRIPGALRLEPG
jgi:hypothetical protein